MDPDLRKSLCCIRRDHLFQKYCSIHPHVKDKSKKEVDFLTLKGNDPEFLIEVKTSDSDLSDSLSHFAKLLRPARNLQLVQNIKRELEMKGTEILEAANWLATLES